MAATSHNKQYPGYPIEFYGKPELYVHIGRGTYGDVFLSLTPRPMRSDGSPLVREEYNKYAIKKVKCKSAHQLGLFLREVSIPSSLDHPCIISYHDIGFLDKQAYFVMDLADGDLQFLIKSQFFKNYRRGMRVVTAQLTRAVAYLAARNVMHCDIKPANILYYSNDNNADNYRYKLADFGISIDRQCQNSQTDYNVYSLIYRPPEILLSQIPYTEKADVWALGCVIYEIQAGKPAFQPPRADTVERVYSYILRRIGTLADYRLWTGHYLQIKASQLASQPLKFLDDEFASFIRLALQTDPEQRASAYELQSHPLIAGIEGEIPTAPAHVCSDIGRNFVARRYSNISMLHREIDAGILKIYQMRTPIIRQDRIMICLAVHLYLTYLNRVQHVEVKQLTLIAAAAICCADNYLDFQSSMTYYRIQHDFLIKEEVLSKFILEFVKEIGFRLDIVTPMDALLSLIEVGEGRETEEASTYFLLAAHLSSALLEADTQLHLTCLDAVRDAQSGATRLFKISLRKIRNETNAKVYDILSYLSRGLLD